MKQRFWLYRRGNNFYLHDSETGHRESLGTTDRRLASRLRTARNEAAGQPGSALALGRAYLATCDPLLPQRCWQTVMQAFCAKGKPPTQERRQSSWKSSRFDPLRNKKLIETTATDFLDVLATAGAYDNTLLRCLHNLALGLSWLPAPVIPRKLWPAIRPKPKRAITREEHLRILAAEGNPERRLYYTLLWEIGASQTDAARLTEKNIDWQARVLSYQRSKTGEWAYLAIGQRLEAVLRELPAKGPLFPHLCELPTVARSAEFNRRCKVVGVRGVSLHSYRYSLAERAAAAGVSERVAMHALGHSSQAVHRAYAKGARVLMPPLDDAENGSDKKDRHIRPAPLLIAQSHPQRGTAAEKCVEGLRLDSWPPTLGLGRG